MANKLQVTPPEYDENNPVKKAFDKLVNEGYDADAARTLQEHEDAFRQEQEQSGTRRGKEASDLGKAESSGGGAPWNYSRGVSGAGKTQDGSRMRSFITNVSMRKRSIFISAGAGGGILGMTMGMGSFPGLKIPGLVDALGDFAGRRVERIVEKKVGRILIRYFMSGAYAAMGGKGFIHTGSIVGDLFANIRTSKFETKLKAKYGLEIVNNGKGGVRLVHDGKDLGDLDGKTVRQIEDLISKNSLLAKDFKTIVKLETSAFRWMKRAKFARWLRLKYGVPRFGIKNAEGDKPAKEQLATMEKDRIERDVRDKVQGMDDAIKCYQGEGCRVPQLNGDDAKPINNAPSSASDITAVADDAAKAATEAVVTDSTASGSAAASTSSSKLMEIMSRTILGRFAVKAIPIIGWLDLAATLDHIAWNIGTNDSFNKIPAYFKEASYIKLWADWLGYGDQTKAGDMNPIFLYRLANQTDGVEESCTYNELDDKHNRGECFKENEKINENSDRSFLANLWDGTKWIPGAPANVYTHYIFEAYYQTLGGGGLLGWIAGGLGSVVGKIADWFTPDSLQEWFKNFLKEHWNDFMLLLGWAIDHTVGGWKLFNGMFAGAVASFENYCRDEMGCAKLTPEQAAQFDTEWRHEQRTELAELPLTERLFSLNTHRSLASALVMQAPSTLTGSVAKLGSIVGGAPSNLATLMSSPVRADHNEWVDYIGKDAYGEAPGDDSEEGIPAELTTPGGKECPKSDGKNLNQCLAYKVSADSLLCATAGCPDETDNGGVGAAAIGGGVGQKVDYSKIYGVYKAGEVPDSMLCSPGPEYKPGIKLLCGPPVESFKAMNAAFKQQFGGKHMPMGQGYRTAAEQKHCAQVNSACNNYRENQRPPSHLWGTSIDFIVSEFEPQDEYHKWTVANGPKYGWFWPNWAREGRGGTGGHVEPWHFDYYFVGHDASNDRLEGFQQ